MEKKTTKKANKKRNLKSKYKERTDTNILDIIKCTETFHDTTEEQLKEIMELCMNKEQNVK